MEDPLPETVAEKVEDGGMPPKSLNLAELVPEKKVSFRLPIELVRNLEAPNWALQKSGLDECEKDRLCHCYFAEEFFRTIS